MEGDSIVQDASVLHADELEIFSAGKLHIDRGARCDMENDVRLVSTYQGSDSPAIRLGPGAIIESDNLTIIGHRDVRFNSTSLEARGFVSIESRGSQAQNRVSVLNQSRIRGDSLSIISGNRFALKEQSFIRSEQNSHIQAVGCTIQRTTTIEAGTYSGSCLNANRVNQIPTVVIGATPSSGDIPLTVAFNSTGSSDPDGQIVSYEWAFPDGSTSTGGQAGYIFTQAGAYMVKLTVTDNDGALVEQETLITATAPLISPTARLSLSPSSGQAPLIVSLDGSGSSDPDGSYSNLRVDL